MKYIITVTVDEAGKRMIFLKYMELIYRIYCFPENKNYVGQTYSHIIRSQYFSHYNVFGRITTHIVGKDDIKYKNHPLYIALNKYDLKDFGVSIEKRLYGKDIQNINNEEEIFIKKYNCMSPNGYNLEKTGKRYGKMFKLLSEYYKFDIPLYEYKDTTRETRGKDICIGVRFGFKRNKRLSEYQILNLLSAIDIDYVRLIKTGKEIRILVKENNSRDHIRIVYKENSDKCLEYVKKISDKIIIAPSFSGNSYNYQEKLDKLLDIEIPITTITGKHYISKKKDTYRLNFYGKKIRTQLIFTITFGGKLPIQESYEKALEFLNKFKTTTEQKDFKIDLSPIVSNKENEKFVTP